MEKEIKCPLCSNEQLQIVEKIKKEDLVALWEKQGLNTANLFSNIDVLEKVSCNACSLKFFNPYIPGDDSFYSQLGSEDWYYLHEDKTEFDYSNKYIKEGDNVLDIGSGRGAFTKYIDKSITYTGLELSSKAIEDAKKENINVIESTIEDYSTSNKDKHDVVVTFQVMEHIVNIDSFVKATIEVVKPNGLFIIAVPNNDSFIKDAQNSVLNLPPHHLIWWNETSLKHIANKYNLEIVDVYKEKVTAIHKDFYFITVISSKIRKILGIKTKSVNVSFVNRVINKVSSILASMSSNSHEKEDGQTIAIVLKKKNI